MSRSAKSSPVPTNSGPDVSQLAEESLAAAAFPVTRSATFRVHFDPNAYVAMKAHASEDVSFEICGVLVGDWGRDADGPFVAIRHLIRCDNAAKKFAEVTFTHESWAHINREMDTKFQDQRIVGWYHSHPNFGIFLSDRDLFIQQNFFSGPGQIALVIDPVQKIEGVFEWRDGKAVPTPHFWVGDQIHLAPQGSDVTGMPEAPLEQNSSASRVSSIDGPSMAATPSGPLMMLAGMGLFLMGWFLSGWRSNVEQRAIIEGTVAHFGIWKGLRPDLDTELGIALNEFEHISNQIKPLASEHLQRAKTQAEEKDDEKTAAQTETWKKLLFSIDDLRLRLRQIEMLYMYTPEEKEAVRRYLERKMIELSKANSSNIDSSSGSQETGDKTNKTKKTVKSPAPEKTLKEKPGPKESETQN